MHHGTNGKKRLYIVIILLCLIAVAGYFIFTRVVQWHKSEIVEVKKNEEIKHFKEITKLEEKIDSLDDEILLQKDSIIASDVVKSVFKPAEQEDPDNCARVKNNIRSFFSYLDQKQYHIEKKDNGAIYQDIVKRLSKNQPVFSDQATEVLTLLRSMSHLYRSLGKENIFYIKRILQNEEEMLEPAMNSFHDLFLVNSNCKASSGVHPSFETLYNYACFFQNTLAGKSYLLRRSSKIRILSSYYSILIIDHANDESLNQYGFDIRPSLSILLDEIKHHQKLLYKKEYIETLNVIMEKYPAMKAASY